MGKWFLKSVASLTLGISLVIIVLFSLKPESVQTVLAAGPTFITSTITSNQTWVAADSPYIVQTNTVFILNGAIVTIEPGVTVQFQDNSRLQIDNGQLIAVGTSTNPITFTSSSATPTRGVWQGINFKATKSSTIEHSIIEYGREAIRIDATSTQFSIQTNTIRYAGDNNGTIGDGGAILGTKDESFISYNTIYSSETGIYLNEVADNQIRGNTIYDIDGDCLSLTPGGADSSNNTIVSNQIFNCGARGLSVSDANEGDLNRVNSNVISNTNEAAIYIRNQDKFFVLGNIIYDVPASQGSGLVFTKTNSSGFAINSGINSNVFCVDGQFEVENQDTTTLTVEGNWFGTNTPTVGTEISGAVDFTPSIALAAEPFNNTLPADGVSTTVITVTMNDGAGHAPPSGARIVQLSTDLGSLSSPTATLNAQGVATVTLTAPTTFGTAT
ncbi:MAG: right-handed parallel beta-helix repeat-containing protein, partial [Chloroflexota bacterium]